MAARNIAITLAVKARIRKRPSGRIGSLARDSTNTKTAASDEAERDEAADVGIGPFAELLVGEADEDRHQGRRPGAPRRGSRCCRSAPWLRMVGSVRQMMKSATSAERQVDEEDPVPAEVVGQEAADGRPDEDEMPKTAPKKPWYLPRSDGREDVADDRQRDREQRAGAQALDAAEER